MCPTTPRTRLEVEPRLSAARAAREFLRRQGCPRHAPAVLDVALLLVSELVTNAVRHGRPPIVVEVDCDDDDGLAVEVVDASTELPAVVDLRADTDPDAEGGRGLGLVEALSTSWGVEPRQGNGKSVWFRLDPRRAVAADGADVRGLGAGAAAG